MSNLAEDFERMAKNYEDRIVAAVIGPMGWGDDYKSENVPNYDKIPKGVVLPWEDARKWLDFEYDSGYGAPECPAVYAWSNGYVFVIIQYDGSTWVEAIPRHPINCTPVMPGG